MLTGWRRNLLYKTLGEHSEDWLDRSFGTRSHIDETGTFLAEQGNHFAASAMFGAAFGATYPHLRRRPVAAGALYAATLYVVKSRVWRRC
jgi:hypothetical protein